MSETKRWYLRCCGCLSIMAINADHPSSGIRCAACEGRIEIMGVVQMRRLVRIEERTACDDRCQMATGPSCDCQCQGKNHGRKVMVTVAVDVGGIPRVTPSNPERARRIHGEFLHAKAATYKRIEKFFQPAGSRERAAGIWEAAQSMRARRYLDALDRTVNLKTHHGRLAAIEKINQQITAGSR